MIPTKLSHLRATQNLRASIGDNPYHNQHIKEMAECVDESMYELQRHYDDAFLQLYEQVKALDERITVLEQKVFSTPFQA